MSGRGLWGRFAAVLLLAGALLALAHPSRPAVALPRLAAACAGLAAGAGLSCALARRRPSLRRVGPPPRLATCCVLAAWASAEEVTWRWFALGELTGPLGSGAALALSSALFAAGHRSARRVHVVTGAVFGGVYLGTGSLVAACLAHASYNLCAAAALWPRASPAAGAPG